MKMLLHPLSAASFWLTLPASPSSLGTATAQSLAKTVPTERTAAYLAERYPFLPQPYHLLRPAGRRNATELFHFYSIPATWQDAAFYQIAPGIFAPSPEATLVALAKHLSFHELALVGSAFCGNFRIAPLSPFGIEYRHPLTSTADIRTYLTDHPSAGGSKQLSRALPHFVEGAESPPEILMAMALALPSKYGGSGLSRLFSNWTYLPSAKAQAIAGRKMLRPDALASANGKLVVIEYDSDAAHLSAQQAKDDEAKRLALEADGIKVISIRPGHLKSSSYMELVALEIYAHLGVRPSAQSASYAEQRRKLFQVNRVLDRFVLSSKRC
ncbi:hypothetical protein [Parvibacter caecicola]|uniref:hypothetical protein n=1 Tax=Parvibacter caecicola TaxID=747645 RepID=UPI00272F9C42|nr:hypothetical protein [Parvibacter caecicola]